MTEWSVAVTVPSPEEAGASDAAVAEIAASLSERAPAISIFHGTVTVRIAVEGNDVEAAVERGVGEVRAALESVGWPSDVRDLEATEWSLFEEKLNEPTHPELVGITEIADLLGTSRQRASELARSSRFPAPLADLAAGPVWPKAVVARFAGEWDRKPGRPRSKIA